MQDHLSTSFFHLLAVAHHFIAGVLKQRPGSTIGAIYIPVTLPRLAFYEGRRLSACP
jgi:hypothetical protein